jgi:putative tryptophan/tyrosine transport system substrate-binding protein
MRRREFLIGAASAAALTPLSAVAQPSAPIVGFLTAASADAPSGPIEAIHVGLRQAGYELQRNVRMEYRYGNYQPDRLPGLATELVRLPSSVIIAAGGPGATLVAMKATSSIPIVFCPIPDPVRVGIVASLNRPGGNVTGVTALTIELDSKRIEVLHALTPPGGRIGVLLNPTRPDAQAQLEIITSAARAVGRELVIAHAHTLEEIEAAFPKFVQQSIKGLLIGADPFFSSHRKQVVLFVTRHGWPAVYQWREFVDAGGLASFGANLADSYRQVGLFTARILKGEKPADLPVQQPAKFELVINLKAARALGLNVPIELLGRADEVIE